VQFFLIIFIEICILREYLSEKIMLSEILGKLVKLNLRDISQKIISKKYFISFIQLFMRIS